MEKLKREREESAQNSTLKSSSVDVSVNSQPVNIKKNTKIIQSFDDDESNESLTTVTKPFLETEDVVKKKSKLFMENGKVP